MAEDIFNPDYWRERLRESMMSDEHHAVFRCPLSQWLRIEEAHVRILRQYIKPTDSILDAGCGWGRLLDLLPREWRGVYLGVDLSPDLIFKGLIRESKHPRALMCADLRTLSLPGWPRFDWAILVSMRPMVRRNAGDEVWGKIEANIRAIAKRLLYLEYDETDQGSVE